MKNNEYFLTPEGVEKLRAELEELTGPRRIEIAQRLRHAVEMGDLSENADYINAKEDQAFLEGRIQELEIVLRDAVVIDKESASSEMVGIGSTVVVSENGNDPETFKIVGVKEADSQRGRISHKSPVGKSIMGKREGDSVTLRTPSGETSIKILEIK
jgi:transcription elongation factor GreA